MHTLEQIDVEEAARTLRCNPSWRHVALLGLRGAVSAATLGDALRGLGRLRTLRLADVRWHASALSEFGSWLGVCLVRLQLSEAHVDNALAVSIAGRLPQLSALRTLQLAGNHISNRGASALAARLPATRIADLDLRANNIGNGGARALALALPRAGRLRKLRLADNEIEQGALHALVQRMAGSALSELDADCGSANALRDRIAAWNRAALDGGWWSFERHRTFPRRLREAVVALLVLARRGARGLSLLPIELLCEVWRQLCAASSFDAAAGR